MPKLPSSTPIDARTKSAETTESSAPETTSLPVLPAAIATYFAADRRDGAAIADCFVQNAVVKDEGRTHVGVAEIKRWREASSSKYDYTSEPLRFESKDGLAIVTSRVTGNFPGSPVDLRYLFKLDGDKIASLEIAP